MLTEIVVGEKQKKTKKKKTPSWYNLFQISDSDCHDDYCLPGKLAKLQCEVSGPLDLGLFVYRG